MIDDSTFSFDYQDEIINTKPSFEFLNTLRLKPEVKSRLNSYLMNLSSGSDDVIVAGMCNDIRPETLLAEWDVFFNAHKHKLNSDLLKLEVESRGKFGPRSICQPWSERVHNVREHFSSHGQVNISIKPYRNRRILRPKSFKESVKFLRNSTNSGLPYFCRKSNIKSKLLELIDNGKFRDELLSRKDPCILFTRTQEGGKTRDVWGYPVADTLFEMSYYQPLLQYQKKLSWRSAINDPETVNKAVSSMVNKCLNNRDFSLVSIDFSAFDRSISPDLSRACFQYIKDLYHDDYHQDLEQICDRFINIPLLTPSGIMYGSHGVPSGSTFTNEVDSIAQYLVAFNLGVEIFDFQVQGDDGVYLILSSDVDKFTSGFKRFGLMVNNDKTLISDKFCVYLRSLFHTDYKDESGIICGVYPIYRALGRLCFQERFVDFLSYDLSGKDYYSLRTISILENCKYHPLFVDFVKFIYSKDKYLLSYSKESLGKYKRLQSEIFGFDVSLNPRPGDDISGLSSFKTIKVIQSIA